MANLTLIHNPTYVWPNSYIRDADKDAFLSGADPDHILTESFESNDYGVLASAGPFALLPAEEQPIRLSLYDVGGRKVRLLAVGSRSAGTHTLRWDGRDQAGRNVAAGRSSGSCNSYSQTHL